MFFTGCSRHPGPVRTEELDDIVQGLAVAKYALETHDEDAAVAAVDAALVRARRLLSAETAGDLTRSRPAGG
jgi:hypothetical protein